VLVFDAESFIGVRLAEALGSSDWATPVLVYRSGKRPRLNSTTIETLALDISNASEVGKALSGAASIANCIVGSAHKILVNAHALFGPATRLPAAMPVVHMSSLAVYGTAQGAVSESTPPVGPLSAYGAARLEAERLATAGSTAVIIRPGIVYGPASEPWSARIARLLFSRRLGDLGRFGDGYCNLLYIDDLIDTMVYLLKASFPARRVLNLSTASPPTWNEYFVDYAKSLGAVPVARIGARQLAFQSKILAPPQKVAEIIGTKIAPRLVPSLPHAIPPSLLQLFRQRLEMKTEANADELPIQRTSLEEGLRHASHWYTASIRRSGTC